MDAIPMPWGSMAYSDSGGAGRPIVLLHGTGCDTTDWRSVIEALPAVARTIPLDFRGHGSSAVPRLPFTLRDLADDVTTLIDTLHIEGALLVGHSLGGMVAIEAARISARVRGLVLLEGWPRLSAAQAFSGNHFYGNLDSANTDRIDAKYRTTISRFTPDVWAAFWSSVECFDGLDVLRSATIPVIAAFGDVGRNDLTLKTLTIPEIPTIGMRWIPGAGHYLPHERPVEVASLIGEAYARAGE
jgi:pimeloyl-ACP methyl ester carboxylesterase